MSDQDDDRLPLADFDQLSLGALESRIRSLSSGQLEKLLHHESGHANRVPVVEVLRARIDQLAAGAEPSPGSERGNSDRPPNGSTRGGSPVSPATATDVNPPPHGTPEQSGKPKGDRPL
ncbi:hypothetical protein [Streptomyces sp. NPDC017993]|uniref:hypothetical protein n=1 Tax=Streptomyces sp. NPDC017993 TaxID=3365027 RepID=UPI00379DCFCF